MISRKLYTTLSVIFGGGILFFLCLASSNNIQDDALHPKTYAPNLWFDSEEKYFPTTPLFYTDQADQLSGEEAKNKYLAFSFEEKKKNFKVFYALVDNGDEWVYQYWIYYVFNDYKNGHYHDWELIDVFVNKNNQRINRVIGSAHLGSIQNGEISDLSLDRGDKVFVYVERGSHANSVSINGNGDPTVTHLGSWAIQNWGSEDRRYGFLISPLDSAYQLEDLNILVKEFGNKKSFPNSPSLGLFPIELPGISETKYVIPIGGNPPIHAWHKPEYHDPEKASPITITKVAKAVNEKVKAGVNTATKLAKATFNLAKDRIVTAYRNVKNTAQLVFERVGDSMRTAFSEAKKAFGGKRDVARSLQAGLPFALERVNTQTVRSGEAPNVSLSAVSRPQNIVNSNLKPNLQQGQPVVEESQATDTHPIDSHVNSGFVSSNQGNSGGVEEEPVFVSEPELNFDATEVATDTSSLLSDPIETETFLRIGPDNSSFEEPLSSEPVPFEPVLPEIPEEPEVILPPEPPGDEPLIIDPRAVVINEIAWMGTGASGDDQWIELHNTSDQDISLEGWKISWVWVLAFGMRETTEVRLSGTIPAHGYYLIERCIPRFEELHGDCDYAVSDIPADLIYSNDLPRIPSRPVYMRLWNPADEEVDWVDMWYAGSDIRVSIQTMERVSPYVWGHNANWLSASAGGVTGLDANGSIIIGTPKAQNSVYGSYTLIGGSHHEDITLYRNRSPYLLYDDSLTIEAGGTLTIEPGVLVKIHSTFGDTGIVVYGTIKARGTETEPIVFTSDLDSDHGGSGGAVPGVWKGIRISSESPDSIFDYTIIRYAGYYPAGFENSSIALLIQNAPILFSNSVIEYSRTKGLWFSYSASVIEHSLFQNNGIAIFSDNVGDIQATIRNSIFRNNVVHLWVQDGLEPIQEGNIFE